MIVEWLLNIDFASPISSFLDWASDNYFDISKDKVKVMLSEKQTTALLKDMLDKEKNSHKLGSISNEFDIEGLGKYIIDKFWTEFPIVFFSNTPEKSKNALNHIITTAKYHAGNGIELHTNNPSEDTIIRIVFQALAILAAHYEAQVDPANKYVAAGIERTLLDAINKNSSELIDLIRSTNTTPPAKYLYKSNSFFKTEEFSEHWNRPMFLDSNISLNDLYDGTENFIVPPYSGKQKEGKRDLKNRLLDYSKVKDGLILFGPPGIGKSTIVSWLCNHGIVGKEIFAYSIAQVFNENNGHSSSYGKEGLDYILDRVDLLSYINSTDYAGDGILILDGLDEISGEIRELDKYVVQIIKDCRKKQITPIITCRTTYIQNRMRLRTAKCSFVILTSWDSQNIASFVDLYLSKTHRSITPNTKKELLSNTKLYGIPLMVYLVLALQIQIGENENEAILFDRIFDKKGRGIFGRYILKRNGETETYEYVKEVDIDKVRVTLKTSKELAFKMFESGTAEVSQPFDNMENIFKEYFISRNITEGINQVTFVHRTMYEYFVVENLIEKLENLILEPSFQMGNISELATILTSFFKKGKIDNNGMIKQFLTSKITVFIEKNLSLYTKDSIYHWWEDTFLELFKHGMLSFAYRQTDIFQCSNILKEEQNCTEWILFIWDLVFSICCPSDTYKLANYKNPSEIEYMLNTIRLFTLKENLVLNHISVTGLDLSKHNISYSSFCGSILQYAKFQKSTATSAVFSGATLVSPNFNNATLNSADFTNSDLSQAYMSEVSLVRATLKNANLPSVRLTEANLTEANLTEADLTNADLRRANLKGINLSKAILINANLSGADLSGANLREADLTGANLEDANLYGASMKNAILSGATLKDAIFEHTNLRDTILYDVDLTNIDLKNAYTDGMKCERTESEPTVTVQNG